MKSISYKKYLLMDWNPSSVRRLVTWRFSPLMILKKCISATSPCVIHQYRAANKLRASFSRYSNEVKNVLFRSFCTPTYASQLWCDFRKSCMQRLRVAYNCGCRALYDLPWRVVIRFTVIFLPLRHY